MLHQFWHQSKVLSWLQSSWSPWDFSELFFSGYLDKVQAYNVGFLISRERFHWLVPVVIPFAVYLIKLEEESVVYSATTPVQISLLGYWFYWRIHVLHYNPWSITNLGAASLSITSISSWSGDVKCEFDSVSHLNLWSKLFFSKILHYIITLSPR